MISDNEARRYAAKIRRGTDTIRERGDYDRWSRATKGRRPRTPLAVLLAERDARVRAQRAASDLLQTPHSAASERTIPSVTIDGSGFDTQKAADDYLRQTSGEKKDPIAPPLPALDGEIVEEPIAPPVDLGEAPAPGFDLGGGVAKAARAALEALDARNPEIGGIALATVFGASFWPAWEAAATRLVAKHVGAVQLADEEMVVAGAAVVVGQPIAIPMIKEHGAEWLAKFKKAVGFGTKGEGQ